MSQIHLTTCHWICIHNQFLILWPSIVLEDKRWISLQKKIIPSGNIMKFLGIMLFIQSHVWRSNHYMPLEIENILFPWHNSGYFLRLFLNTSFLSTHNLKDKWHLLCTKGITKEKIICIFEVENISFLLIHLTTVLCNHIFKRGWISKRNS